MPRPLFKPPDPPPDVTDPAALRQWLVGLTGLLRRHFDRIHNVGPRLSWNADDQIEAEDQTVGVVSVPTGTILGYGAAAAPGGFLVCDGSEVSRAGLAALFAIVGTTYGAGNGSTTFNLPDFRGRSPMGFGSGPGLTARSLGQTLGAESTVHDHARGTLQALGDFDDARYQNRREAASSWAGTDATSIVRVSPSGAMTTATVIQGVTATHATAIVHPVEVINFIIKT